MKYFFLLFLFFCLAANAQKPQPIQVQTVNDSLYVVEFIPIAKAQASINTQLTQVNKQIESLDKQIAELVARRDRLITQQKALSIADAQLDKAASQPAISTQSTLPPAATAPPPKPTKKKPKKE